MHTAKQYSEYQAAVDPVISLYKKKKDNIGDFKNAGQEWPSADMPENVNVYDLTNNIGWVNVGIDNVTPPRRVCC